MVMYFHDQERIASEKYSEKAKILVAIIAPHPTPLSPDLDKHKKFVIWSSREYYITQQHFLLHPQCFQKTSSKVTQTNDFVKTISGFSAPRSSQ